MEDISRSSRDQESSPPDSRARLMAAVRALYDAVDRFDAALAGELGVDRTALRAINAMEAGSLSPGALGQKLGLASGSVTALLDRLERAGHIERTLSPDDRRRRDASLTPETRAMAAARYGGLGEALAAAFSRLEADEVDRAAVAVAAITDAFAASAQPPG